MGALPRRCASPTGLAAVAVVGLAALAPSAPAATAASPAARIEEAISQAESSLRDGARPAAEAHYHEALHAGWLLLAMLELQTGELATSGHGEEAVRQLEAARAAAPDDLELAFGLGSAYLGLARVDPAARVFAQLTEARPIPQTHMLIARTYRDFREYERCRAELRAALAQDPSLRHAHYEMGLTAVKEGGKAGLDEAIAEFQAELKLAPDDPRANLELGVALVESQRPAEALPALELASRLLPPDARALGYLGRAFIGFGPAGGGGGSLKRSLEAGRAAGCECARAARHPSSARAGAARQG